MRRQLSQGDYWRLHQTHTNEVSRNREWQTKPSISSQQSECFIAAVFFFLSPESAQHTCGPVSFQANVEKRESEPSITVFLLQLGGPYPLPVSETLKTLGEWTVGDLASEKCTCYATAYFLLHNAAVSEWKISSTVLFFL